MLTLPSIDNEFGNALHWSYVGGKLAGLSTGLFVLQQRGGWVDSPKNFLPCCPSCSGVTEGWKVRVTFHPSVHPAVELQQGGKSE